MKTPSQMSEESMQRMEARIPELAGSAVNAGMRDVKTRMAAELSKNLRSEIQCRGQR